MKRLVVSLCIVSIVTLAFNVQQTAAVYNNICRLFADGVVIGDPYSCDSYITCVNSVEVTSKCAKGKVFSVDSKKCIESTEGCDDPCAPDIDGVWVSDPKSCSGYFFCRNGTGTFGKCPLDLHFHEDGQQCTYSHVAECEGDNFCHIVPNGINFKDEEACDMYRVCEKRVLKSKSCSSGSLYERSKGSCLPKADVVCDSRASDICKKGTGYEKNKFVSDKTTCRGYYYCADKGKEGDLNPVWGQCPPGEFFNYSDQSCKDPINVVCTADRCDGRADGFVNSNKNCQWYVICKDGKKVDEKQCSNQMFFDEKRQACTSELIQYKACV